MGILAERAAEGQKYTILGYIWRFADNTGVAVLYIQIGTDDKGLARRYIQTKSLGLLGT
jgi:hypothetical protein